MNTLHSGHSKPITRRKGQEGVSITPTSGEVPVQFRTGMLAIHPERIEGHRRLPIEDQFPNQPSRDGGEQDAVAVVSGGDDEARQSGRRAEEGSSRPGRIGPETRPGPDHGQAAESGKDSQGRSEQVVHPLERHAFVKARLLDRRAHQDEAVGTGNTVNVRSMDDVTEEARWAFELHDLALHRLDFEVKPRGIRQRPGPGPRCEDHRSGMDRLGSRLESEDARVAAQQPNDAVVEEQPRPFPDGRLRERPKKPRVAHLVIVFLEKRPAEVLGEARLDRPGLAGREPLHGQPVRPQTRLHPKGLSLLLFREIGLERAGTMVTDVDRGLGLQLLCEGSEGLVAEPAQARVGAAARRRMRDHSGGCPGRLPASLLRVDEQAVGARAGEFIGRATADNPGPYDGHVRRQAHTIPPSQAPNHNRRTGGTIDHPHGRDPAGI